MLILPLSVQSGGLGQAVLDQFNLLFRGGNAAIRLLLEGMQHVHCLGETKSVNSTPRTALSLRHNLHDRSSAKAFQRVCRRIGFTLLRGVQRDADFAPGLSGKRSQISPAGSDPFQRAYNSVHLYKNTSIYIGPSKLPAT